MKTALVFALALVACGSSPKPTPAPTSSAAPEAGPRAEASAAVVEAGPADAADAADGEACLSPSDCAAGFDCVHNGRPVGRCL